ncbi:hypothetical protein ABK040_003371 [Willaertia magna]
MADQTTSGSFLTPTNNKTVNEQQQSNTALISLHDDQSVVLLGNEQSNPINTFSLMAVVKNTLVANQSNQNSRNRVWVWCF